MNMFHRILCPVDFSEDSDTAMNYAQKLAASSGAELIALHAFDVPESYDEHGQTHPADRELVTKLHSIKAVSPGVKLSHALHAGPAGDVICWFAEDRKCDLIVMGTHGRTGLKHFFLGSVAEHVVRNARCPVLVLRTAKPGEPPLSEPHVLPPPAPRLM
jgi:universal stress protein A